MEYPIFNSKALSDGNKYDLVDVVERKKYFQAKLGSKIDEVKQALDAKSGFVGYLLAKKQSGKGTYSKMIQEILDIERFSDISVGDVVRKYHKLLEDPATKSQVYADLKKEYRGYISLDDSISALLSRTQDKVSVPSEMLLTLLKLELDKSSTPALFIDGLPRTVDQISYSLFFRQLFNYNDAADFFVLIDVPDAIIDARMKNRVVCPICATSKNFLFNPSKFVKYDQVQKSPFLLCDNANCAGFGKERLIGKDGDLAGIESVRGRMDQDQQLMDMAIGLHGVPKVLLRSNIPLDQVNDTLEDYEIQKIHKYKLKVGSTDEVEVYTEPWIYKDNNGVDCCTMFAATFVVNLFTQIHSILV